MLVMLLEVGPCLGAVGKPLLPFAGRMFTLGNTSVNLPKRHPINFFISPQKFFKDEETEINRSF